MSDSLFEKTISSETVYKGRIIDLKIDEVELPNGKTSKRELINHPGAVAIIALTPEGKLLLIRQFRKPLEKVIVEIPAGKLEANEDPADCAKRELEEETGFTTAELEHVTSFYTSPGFADEIVHLYFTDKLLPGKQETDDDEFVEVIEATLAQAEEMIQSKEIYDAKTAYAIQYLKLRSFK
ncbi:NUDIX domain-containing protein [Bacillus sp. FJAT-45350]|uniref:NUDIX domain-containing protein n=1 Tax=Bacillus sp. FJAT-45350 TaxID=2011014 RepID=UPI000BB8E971|nr:NUDIX hydrolase [Bacillus sp. FJAT-45350]